MQGYQVTAFGGVEVMKWVELPDPAPGPGQLRVAVRASGINFAETRMRAGTYSGQALPFVMGMESAGVVEAVGPGVTGFRPGDRVFGRARGSHATQVLFDAEHTLPLPESLDFVQGAAIPVGWLTAWHALVTVGDAQGLSYYSDAALCRHLQMDPTQLASARRQLESAELIAYAKPLYQVLALQDPTGNPAHPQSPPLGQALAVGDILRRVLAAGPL